MEEKRFLELLESNNKKMFEYIEVNNKKIFEHIDANNEKIYKCIDDNNVKLEKMRENCKNVRDLGRKINIKKAHPHKFRSTFSTVAVDKGMSIEQVQKILGHVKIETTMHYTMVNQESVKYAHRKFMG